MAKNSKKRKQRKSAQQSSTGFAKTAPPGDVREPPRNLDDVALRAAEKMPSLHFVLGVVFLFVAVTSSLMLVLQHFGGLHLPGCGAGSPCAEAAASAWGSIPIGGRKWPVSFLGLAYFAGALLAWTQSRRGLSTAFLSVVRLGALVSLGFTVVIGVDGHTCMYCLAAHAANFAFWLVTERARKTITATALRPVAVLVAVFVLSSGAMFAVETREKTIEAQRQEKDHASSTDAIVAETKRKAQAARETQAPTQPAATETVSHAASTEEPVEIPHADVEAVTAPPSTDTSQSADATAIETATAPDTLDRPWTGGFRGRYLLGPELAAVRVVMITDYQCPDCYRIEGEVMAAVEADERVSLSIKHFPMCKDCNPHFATHNMHPNACWAARAAEAAGILYGNEGFWKMHRWLFKNKGTFTDEALKEGLAELGFDAQEFIPVMTRKVTEDLVKSDIAEAIWLGLHYTPMIFINGVELQGVFAGQAGPRAIRKVLAANPPPMNHDLDQPPPAIGKYVTDWHSQPQRIMPPDASSWQRGSEGAKLKIVVWGDYQEPYTAEADTILRTFIEGRDDASYSFRHYPISKQCNPVTPMDKHPNACLASRAAEAAGQLGGLDVYWNMHVWLMENQTALSEAALADVAAGLGLDSNSLQETMNGLAVTQAIEEDCKAAKSVGLRSIPFIFVNGRYLPRWRLEGQPALVKILETALED